MVEKLNTKTLKQIKTRLLTIRMNLPTTDEVWLIQFDKELIRAVDALDFLLFYEESLYGSSV